MERIIGIPTSGPELSDDISAHFGHCDYFIGIKVQDDNKIEIAFVKQNSGHSGCMEPVMAMKERNVTDMIVGGIGGRPFMGFIQLGINLFQGVEGSVNDNIENLLQGKLKPLDVPICGGGGHSSGCNHSN